MTNSNYGNIASKNRLVIALVLVLVILISSVAIVGCSKKEDQEAAGNAQVAFDEATFVLADGISFGNLNVGGKVCSEVRALAEEECLKMINDFTITVNAENEKNDDNKTFEFKKEHFAWDTNIDDLIDRAVSVTQKISSGEIEAGSSHFELEVTVNKASVEAAVAAVAGEVDILPVNANIDTSGKTIKFTKEKNGYQVDKEKLVGDILAALEKVVSGKETKFEINAEMKETEAAVKMEDIEGNITLLATYSTTSQSTANGNHNMMTALEACNGSVIEPGEIWSFNACTGDSNLTSNGYLPGTVIINGEFQQGVGGGICQASTTIYNAAVRANLQVVERYSHYYPSSYADPGMDATIDYPALDLRLKNITEYPIYIQCHMEGTKLYCSIYGWQDPSFDEIKVTSYFYGYNREDNIYYGAAYRTFYKDGQELYSEDLPGSTYRFTSPSEHTSEPSTEPSSEVVTGTDIPTDIPTGTVTPTDTQPPTENVTTPPTENQPSVTPPTQVETTPTQPEQTPPQDSIGATEG